MRRLLLLSLALLACLPVLAQDAYTTLEQRMPAEEFKATGLDQLSPEQLARLNAWLRKEQGAQVQAVRAEVKQEVQQEVRQEARQDSNVLGDLFGRDKDPVVSTLPGEFRGWSGKHTFTLANGQVWRATEVKDLSLRRPLVDPTVTVKPGFMGAWYLQVDKYPSIKVERVK